MGYRIQEPLTDLTLSWTCPHLTLLGIQTHTHLQFPAIVTSLLSIQQGLLGHSQYLPHYIYRVAFLLTPKKA